MDLDIGLGYDLNDFWERRLGIRTRGAGLGVFVLGEMISFALDTDTMNVFAIVILMHALMTDFYFRENMFSVKTTRDV